MLGKKAFPQFRGTVTFSFYEDDDVNHERPTSEFVLPLTTAAEFGLFSKLREDGYVPVEAPSTQLR